MREVIFLTISSQIFIFLSNYVKVKRSNELSKNNFITYINNDISLTGNLYSKSEITSNFLLIFTCLIFCVCLISLACENEQQIPLSQIFCSMRNQLRLENILSLNNIYIYIYISHDMNFIKDSIFYDLHKASNTLDLW